MKTTLRSFCQITLALGLVTFALPVEGAKSTVLRPVKQRLLRQTGNRAAKEAASTTAEQTARAGGRTLARQTANVSPSLRPAAEKLIRTHGDDAARLIVRHGDDAVVVMTRHPGVGADMLSKLGREAIPLSNAVSPREMSRLARHLDDVAALPPSGRQSMVDAMTRMPGQVGDFLEAHPRLLKTGGWLAVAGGTLVVVDRRIDRGQEDVKETFDGMIERAFPVELDPKTGLPVSTGTRMVRAFGVWFILFASALVTIRSGFGLIKYRMRIRAQAKELKV